MLSLERMLVGDRSKGSMSGYFIPFSSEFSQAFLDFVSASGYSMLT